MLMQPALAFEILNQLKLAEDADRPYLMASAKEKWDNSIIAELHMEECITVSDGAIYVTDSGTQWLDEYPRQFRAQEGHA